ncbi:hypothetical protein RB653_008912 [Dictyostelium firmibasis]|uniref:Ribosomal RNA methyltransferase FtsJ domain-containing protein n=1 Tax=Dictyostelium firmibasis TaxID=79012 RepID=A0AAN7YWY9_9MYCE
MINTLFIFKYNNKQLFSNSIISSQRLYSITKKSKNLKKPIEHVNKPSISNEESLFQIFEKYEFNKRELSNQTIWLPILKTQNYNFNPLNPKDSDIYHQNFDFKLLNTFKQNLSKELRSINKDDPKKLQKQKEIFKIEKSLFITEANQQSPQLQSQSQQQQQQQQQQQYSLKPISANIEKPEDFLDIDKCKPLKSYLSKSIYSMNQIIGNDDHNNIALVWTQQILPNSYRIQRSPNSSIKDLATECFNYLYPILNFLNYIYRDQFSYVFHPITNCREDDDNEKELKLKVKKIRRAVESKIEDARKRIYKQQFNPLKETVGIVYDNITNLNGLNQFISNNNNNNTNNDIEEKKNNSNNKVLFVIQLLLTTETNDLYVSVGKTNHTDGKGWSYPLPYPQGVVSLERDTKPPSRAYKKLIEAFQLMGTTPLPGSRIVELGSSPGGWTSIINRLHNNNYGEESEFNEESPESPESSELSESLHGAPFEIHSIDRVKLAPQFNKCKNIHQYQENGMKWLPPNFLEGLDRRPVNWLLNDMAVAPKNSLETLERWIKDKHAQYFIWAIKFTGEESYKSIVLDSYSLMEKYNIKDFKIKHLTYQGNEIMLMGKIY